MRRKVAMTVVSLVDEKHKKTSKTSKKTVETVVSVDGVEHTLVMVMDESFRGRGRNVFMDKEFLRMIFEGKVPNMGRRMARWEFISPGSYSEGYKEFEETQDFDEFISLIGPHNNFYARHQLEEYLENNQDRFMVVKAKDRHLVATEMIILRDKPVKKSRLRRSKNAK